MSGPARSLIVSQIAAMSSNRAIGQQNKLPWHLPEDLKYFKEKTRGHICIMGRKTFDSIGRKPLPRRYNIVISRNAQLPVPDGVVVAIDISAALELASRLVQASSDWPEEIFICGGAEIYRVAMPYTQRIYLTEVQVNVQGDAHFPDFSLGEFEERSREHHGATPEFDFVVYERPKKPLVPARDR